MSGKKNEISYLISGMRAAFDRGENMMSWARSNSSHENTTLSTLISYDHQAGSYVSHAREQAAYTAAWCAQLANLLEPLSDAGDRVLEVGVGEATTLVGVMQTLAHNKLTFCGLDVSWSRLAVAQEWANEHLVKPRLFVGDLFTLPMADNSVDIIYTSHSLEPNGGREIAAIAELLRVARKAVVLVEPIYELGSADARARMDQHGYVRDLKGAAESLGAKVASYGLLEIFSNALNPSGVVVLEKPACAPEKPYALDGVEYWRCPLTGAPMQDKGDLFFAEAVGLAYPVLRGIPLLRPEHSVVASKIQTRV